MLDLKTYIDLCIKKKKWTYTEFVNRVNYYKKILGDKGVMRVNNISEILNSGRAIDEKTLIIFEKVLGLKENSLYQYSVKSKDRSVIEKNKKIRERLRDVRI